MKTMSMAEINEKLKGFKNLKPSLGTYGVSKFTETDADWWFCTFRGNSNTNDNILYADLTSGKRKVALWVDGTGDLILRFTQRFGVSWQQLE